VKPLAIALFLLVQDPDERRTVENSVKFPPALYAYKDKNRSFDSDEEMRAIFVPELEKDLSNRFKMR
jgi:hypothetical protein